MPLSTTDRDATIELANIGISRAARQLSTLLDDEIRIQVPSATLSDGSLTATLGLNQKAAGNVACVYQNLSGELTGRVALLLPSRDSRVLFQNLISQGTPLQGIDLRAFEHEAMTEIGNIIISSCVSAMADTLKQNIRISVPRYAEASLDDLIDDDAGAGNAALLIHTRLKAVRRNLEGVIILMFSPGVDNCILEALHRIMNKSGGDLCWI